MRKYLTLLLLSFLLIPGCPYPPYNRYIHIQPVVVNLQMLNTPYDDFNAAAPPGYYGQQELLFATNAPSKGERFDIQHSTIVIYMSWIPGVKEDVTSSHTFSLIASNSRPFLEDTDINSSYDEYSPFLLHPKNQPIYLDHSHTLPDEVIYLFASNRPYKTGDFFNIYYYTKKDGLKYFQGNSSFHDYYPSYHEEKKTLYFCSNRDGPFHIYRYHSKDIETLEGLLQNQMEAEPVQELNSFHNDKCPFIYEDIMVFASDREGTFNLYYSRFQHGEWSLPEMLPAIIQKEDQDPFHYLNTEFNEYRPILFQGWADRTDNNLCMIFSSDRPGGQGGYDLYLAVLPLDIFH